MNVELLTCPHWGQVTVASAAAGWTGSGDENGATYGFSVGSAGDVNGDGYSDVIVGADSQDAGGTDRGRAYVYLGSASGLAAVPAWTAESSRPPRPGIT